MNIENIKIRAWLNVTHTPNKLNLQKYDLFEVIENYLNDELKPIIRCKNVGLTTHAAKEVYFNQEDFDEYLEVLPL
jgi:hypothetical protein